MKKIKPIKQKTVMNLLSLVMGCCLCGLYLIGYTFHICNQMDNYDIPQRYIRWIVEKQDVESVVTLDILPIIAQDTYVTEDDYKVVEEEPEPVEDVIEEEPIVVKTSYSDELTKSSGVCSGPSGKETWYNLPMDKVIKSMRNRGYTESEYPYYIREDGVKTLGGYVMVAADLNKYNKGDLVETSKGTGIVCDTGEFAETGDADIDIAVTW